MEAIADEGAMTRAAKRLHITQSALSHQLARLEAAFEVSFFRRVPKGMILTAAGEKLLATARSVLAELRATELRLAPASAYEGGTLRISTGCYTCYHWLPQSLRQFHAAFPKVEVRIAVESTHKPLEALLAGALDVAIVSARPPQATIEARALFDDELVAIANPAHRLATRPFLEAEDFAPEHLLTYSVEEADLTIFQEFLNPARVRPARVSKAELTEAIVEMVKANLGIAVVARWAVARQLGPALAAVRLGRSGFHRTWYAATLRSRPAYVDEFIEILAQNGTLV